jgi:hypothetical protein
MHKMAMLTLEEAGQMARERATLEDPDLMSLAVLLAEFRRYIEREAEVSIDEFEANAGLLLHDLCEFLHFGEKQRAQVLGPASDRIETMLDS